VSQNTIVGGVEQILNTGDLVGDLAKTGLQKLFLQEQRKQKIPLVIAILLLTIHLVWKSLKQ
jgi:hypothetical protein